MKKVFTKIAGLSVGLAMAIGVGVAVGSKEARVARADDVTITFGDQGWENASTHPDFTVSNFRFLTSGSGNATTYYTNDSTLRYYKKNTLTISSTDNASITAVSSSPSVTFSVSEGVATASFSATVKFKSITLTYDSAATGPFTVAYDANGGSGSMSDPTEYEKNAEVTVLNNAFSAADSLHDFDSFNTKKDGSGTKYAGGAKFNITSNTTLYAQWKIKDVTLGNGSYTATFPFVAAGYPSEIAVKDSNNNSVGLMGVSATGLSRYSTYDEYQLAVTGSVVFKNHTNAPVTKIVVNVYQYDNFKLSLGSTVLHTGDGSKGSGDPVVFEITPATPSTDDIKLEHYSGTGSYTQKFYSIDFYFKIGSDVVHPTSVSLNAQSGNVYLTKTRQLTATVLPANADDKTVSWSSDNGNVATVDEDGLVTAVAAGTANITATTTDGGLTATFVATVKALDYGTLNSPLSVEEARDVLEVTGSSTSAEELYVVGVVSLSTYDSTHSNYTVWLKNSVGTVDKYFELYGTNIDSSFTTDYTAKNALAGLTVVCHGYGKIYSGTYELTFVNSNYPEIEKIIYDAATFAAALLSETKATCDAYVDGETDYDAQKAALETIWDSLEPKYDTLSDSEKAILDDADRNQSGTTIEQAMARYDFLAGKYQLDNFITGRVPMSFANVGYGAAGLNADNNTMIIVIAITAISALAFTMLLVFKKKKQK